jgi:hypothetical protein
LVGPLTALPLASTYSLASLLPGIVGMPTDPDATAGAMVDLVRGALDARQLAVRDVPGTGFGGDLLAENWTAVNENIPVGLAMGQSGGRGAGAGRSTTSGRAVCIARRAGNCAGKRRSERLSAKRREDPVVAAGTKRLLVGGLSVEPTVRRPKDPLLTIVDNFTRVLPAIDVRLSYRRADVVATPERIAEVYSRPKRIRVDNGPVFISKDLDPWAWLQGVELDFSRPGRPTDNAFAESFNGKFRTDF